MQCHLLSRLKIGTSLYGISRTFDDCVGSI